MSARSTGLLRAALLPARGLARIAASRPLWPWVAAPAALFGALAVAALALGWGWASDTTAAWLGPAGRGLHAALYAALWLLAHAVAAALGVIGAWYATAALTGPFHDRLSQLVEAEELGSSAAPDATGWWTDLVMGVTHTLAAAAVWAAAGCALLPLQIVPVAGEVAYVALGALVSAASLAWQTLDYPLSRRRMTLREKGGVLRAHPGETLGRGLGTLALLLVPGVNLLAMPAAVVGATWLVCDLERAGRLR